MQNSKTALVILAGGQGSRMGFLTDLVPKPILHALDEPILIRQIRQAQTAGLKNIVVTTTDEYFKVIDQELKRFNVKVKLLRNPKHYLGSLPALLYILSKINKERIIMSFSDIYFLENPYAYILKYVDTDANHCIGVSSAFHKKELSNGGIVFTNKRKGVTEIVEKPLINNNRGSRWNGLAIFNRDDKFHLKNFLKISKPGSPEGEFFEYLRKLNITMKSVLCPDFININEPSDLIVASLYRLNETIEKSSTVKIVKQLRTNFLLHKDE